MKEEEGGWNRIKEDDDDNDVDDDNVVDDNDDNDDGDDHYDADDDDDDPPPWVWVMACRGRTQKETVAPKQRCISCKRWILLKLDGVGPIDNRPSTH